MEESQVPWSDLPPQLWPVIGERLHTYIDVLRFRSVCRLWRDSLPKLNAIFPLFLSDSINEDPLVTFHEILLFRRIIYRFSPVDHDNSVSSKGWLAKMESTNLADTGFQRPIYYNQSFNNEVLKEVNFLDFGIQEVAKSYILGCTNTYTTVFPVANKVVVFPDSACIDLKNCIFVAIQFLGKLVFRKHGDTNWQRIGEKISPYDDVIVYKDKIYTIDREGRVFLIDSSSSMELVQFSAPMSVSGDLKQFVECGGELYVVDRFVERKTGCRAKAIDFKVHRLDQRRRRWVEIKNLGNEAFVLGMDCFSVSATGVEGFEGSCIYFSHEVHSDLGRGYSTHVFDLEKRNIMKSSVQILRAPLVLLDWKASDQPLNERKWVEVKDLGNQAFVLGVDCFSVSAPHFEGFERSCIYFSHELNLDLGCGPITHVFDLEKRSIMESSVQILKAPPVWLEWEASQPANHNSSKRLKS